MRRIVLKWALPLSQVKSIEFPSVMLRFDYSYSRPKLGRLFHFCGLCVNRPHTPMLRSKVLSISTRRVYGKSSYRIISGRIVYHTTISFKHGQLGHLVTRQRLKFTKLQVFELLYNPPTTITLGGNSMEKIQKIFCHNSIISPTQKRVRDYFQEMSKAEFHDICGNIMARKPTVLVFFWPLSSCGTTIN